MPFGEKLNKNIINMIIFRQFFSKTTLAKCQFDVVIDILCLCYSLLVARFVHILAAFVYLRLFF